MHQLVGLPGKRFLLCLNLLQYVALAAIAAFALLLALSDSNLVPFSPWSASLVLIPAYGLVIVMIGMFWWALSSTAVRLEQGLWHVTFRRRVLPALGCAALGTIVSHVWLVLTHAGVLGDSGALAVVPALLGLMAAGVLLGPSLIRSARRVQSERRSASKRDRILRDLAERFGPEALERVQVTTDIESGHSPADPLSAPKGNVLYGLPSKPWYEVSEFSWAQALEENFEAIRAEALSVLTGTDGFEPYDYPGVSMGGWTSFPFVSRREIIEENCRKCPKTAELLTLLPRYPHFRDAMFSLLAPGRIIPPHQDFTNLYLTCHLGIQVPPGCGIEVAGRKREWREGKCLIFDSSYVHSAWNRGNDTRLVLLIDFLHPELNEAEFAWVERLGA